MTIKEAKKSAKNSRDNFICLNDKYRGWVIWNGKYPFVFGKANKPIKNEKTLSIFLKRNDWQIADIPDDKRKDIDSGKAKIGDMVMKVIASSDDAW